MTAGSSQETVDVGRLNDTVLSLVTQVAELRGLAQVIGSGLDPAIGDVSDRVQRVVDSDRVRMDRIEEMVNSFQNELRSEYALCISVSNAIEVHNSEMVETIAEVNCTYERPCRHSGRASKSCRRT